MASKIKKFSLLKKLDPLIGKAARYHKTLEYGKQNQKLETHSQHLEEIDEGNKNIFFNIFKLLQNSLKNNF